MADLPSSFLKVNDIEVAQDAPVTENLLAKLGSNDNWLYDELVTNTQGVAPFQTLTVTKARLDLAHRIQTLANAQSFLGTMNLFYGHTPGNGSTRVTSPISVGTYYIVMHQGVGAGIITQTPTAAGDTFVGVALNRWFHWGNNSTTANMTVYMQVFEYVSV